MTEQNEINRTPTPGRTAAPSAVDAFLLNRQSSTAGEASAPPERPNYRLDGGTLTCLVCGKQGMPPDTKFCGKCGTKFSEALTPERSEEQRKPDLPEPEPLKAKYNCRLDGQTLSCTACGGKSLPRDSTSCKYCHISFTEPADAEAVEKIKESRNDIEKHVPKKKCKLKKKHVLAGLIVILTVVLLFTLIIPGIRYAKGASLQKQGKYAEAAITFGKAGHFFDARDRSFAMWDKVARRDTLATSGSHTVGLKTNGSVVAVGKNNSGQCDVRAWKDIIAVAVGGNHTVGLKSDGTVVAVGSNENGQCNVSDWKDIVAIAADGDRTIGLRKDGTVVATNKTMQKEVKKWKDIVSIAIDCVAVGLKTDGTVVTAESFHDAYTEDASKVKAWSGIVAITAGFNTIGMRENGTFITTGDQRYCPKGAWPNVRSLFSVVESIFGVNPDGTVAVLVNNMSIEGAGNHTIEQWQHIVAVVAGKDRPDRETSAYCLYVLGLRSDGTVISAGQSVNGACDVSDWKNIKVPEGQNP